MAKAICAGYINTKMTSNANIRTLLRFLTTPLKIQQFLDNCTYNHEPLLRSPLEVLLARKAHCLDGAVFAAAGLRHIGYKPLLMDLRAVNDDDHVLALFQIGRSWGALAKSNYSGLRYREPIYRSLRELAISYFDDYFNLRAERTLRQYSRPLNLDKRWGNNWLVSSEIVEEIGCSLDNLRHYNLLNKIQIRQLTRIDRRLFEAGKLGRQV